MRMSKSANLHLLLTSLSLDLRLSREERYSKQNSLVPSPTPPRSSAVVLPLVPLYVLILRTWMAVVWGVGNSIGTSK